MTDKKQDPERTNKTVRDMVHDVGNPLQIISGRAQLLSSAVKDDEELLKNLAIIQEQCEKAREVLDNMLELFPPQDPQ